MLKTICKFITIFGLLSGFLFAEDFYCTADVGYTNFIKGTTTDLNGTASYSSLSNCQGNCKTYKPCEPKAVAKNLALVSGATKLTELEKVAFEGQLSPEMISSILIVSNGVAGTYDFSTAPINGLAFTFPTIPTDVLNPTATKIAWSSGTNSIKLKATMEVTSYSSTCTAGDTKVGAQCYHVNSTYAIPVSGICTAGDYKATLCESRTYYTPSKCTTGDTASSGTCYHKTGLKYYQIGATTSGIDIDASNNPTYVDPNTGETFNSTFFFSAEAKYNGFTCKAMKGQILAGDLNNNYFSSKATCETYCVYQNDCATVSPKTIGCEVTDTQYSNPVTDYTGKTVYTQVKQSTQCATKSVEQTGCAEYKVTNSYNEVKYDTSSVGWRYSNYSGIEEATTSALMTEQMQHIFSGWKGKCDSGMMYNNPFNNPMAILSYAMMAYGVAADGGFGDTAQEATKSVSGAFDTAATSISDSATTTAATEAGEGAVVSSSSSGAVIENTSNTTQTLNTSIPPAQIETYIPGETLSQQMTRYNTAWSGTVGGVDLTLKYSALASAALQMAFPPKEDFVQADKLMKAWMGSDEQDVAALAYVQCMASIGLSFPNIVSWSAGDANGMSPELKSYLSNPIRLTDYQVSILITATSSDFVKKGLMPVKVNGDSMTYVALAPMVYQQVGQVICGGKLAVAQNITTAQATPPPSTGGGANVGMMAAKLVCSMLPPPYNLIASLVLDIVTSFESGNACTDQEIAVKWGLIQFKTNQHMNFGQCHYTSTNCAAKWFWGGCMRQTNNYCCYDQIVTRIMMEGIKPQLGKGWTSCNDISINDLKNISFQPCLPSQDPFLDKCFPATSFEEFQTELTRQASKGLSGQSMQDVINQSINSMAIPGKNLAETCKDCNK